MGKDNVNIINIVAKHLKELPKAGLKDFIADFCKLEPPKGCSQIQRNHLEGKTALQMSKFIMKGYTNRHGPAKVIKTLKNIHENQIRINLEKELRESKTTKSKVGTSSGGANRKRVEEEQREYDVKPKRSQRQKTDEEHFINQNRSNLIKLITNVDPVLDDLMQEKLLTQEQYDIILKKGTSQAKMRELYNYIRSWLGLKVKNTVLKIMKEHNPVVIKNLLDKSKAKKK